MWVRGLKPREWYLIAELQYVAPRVGAWIETTTFPSIILTFTSHPVWVRGLKPHANYSTGVRRQLSHPVWVRGLKLPKLFTINFLILVAPRVGAWIET